MIDVNIKKELIQWNLNNSNEYVYSTIIKNMKFLIRINEFPKESMYTLILEDIEVLDFDDWPNNWLKPN